MTAGMCVCAVHCPLSPYHERACCDKATCACWCHQQPDDEDEDPETLEEA